MRELWISRSEREQILIGIAAFVLLLLLVNIVVIRPLLESRSSAEDALMRETQTLDLVTRSAHQAQMADASVAASISEPKLRSGLVGLAQARGLSVARLQSGNQGEISVEFDSAAPQLLYAWLSDVEVQLGVAPVRASIFADGNDAVRATVQFAADGS